MKVLENLKVHHHLKIPRIVWNCWLVATFTKACYGLNAVRLIHPTTSYPISLKFTLLLSSHFV
jgi:hypothetical protein